MLSQQEEQSSRLKMGFLAQVKVCELMSYRKLSCSLVKMVQNGEGRRDKRINDLW